jgi:protein-L-isoaspartate O-methyltransferase
VEGNNGMFDGQVKYEVFNQDHVSALAHYLQDRAATYKLSDMKVLEVGAGSGHLSYYLNLFLAHFSSSPEEPIVTITVMATDNGSRGLNGPRVRKQDASDAICEEKPDIVICSWMVISSDFFFMVF